MKKLSCILFLLITISINSQVKESDSILSKSEYLLNKLGDSVILLDEITLLPKNKFSSQEDVPYYLWFRTKVLKAYPYAKLASERLDTLNARLSRISSKSKQRKYIHIIQDYLEGEFTDQLKKMTTTEGRILIKLIHRQTGKTAYENIRELRSGWRAFWYNTTANIFNLSLKQEYSPLTNNEDFLIENILQREFQNQTLDERPSKLKLDIQNMYNNHNKMINVEEYKQMFAKLRKKQKKRN